MDPLTAFSLACGVIQIVDFSTKTLTRCKEIYDHGSLSEYDDVEELSKHLINLQQNLSLPSGPKNHNSMQATEDRGLLKLAEECSATAQDLVLRLQALKPEGAHKRRQAIKKTWKALRDKRDIQEIQKRLDGYRHALTTQILVDLRRRHDLTYVQQSQGFQDLDIKVQMIIASLSLGLKSFEELSQLTRNENEKTREYVNTLFQQNQKQREEKEYRQRLLDSLWFDEIHSREERIPDAHSMTFEWIFDQSGEAGRLENNFVEWLESGQGTYWINGKAGSGKSTFMNFICQDERTRLSLNTWSGNRLVLMPKFYFWNSGTPMQRSVEGLLRSLIWQIYQQLPDLQTPPSDTATRLGPGTCTTYNRDTIAAWTERRLRGTLHSILQQSLRSYHLCMFIDGLDEFDGDQIELVRFIQDITQSTGIKICLSSRPYRAFYEAFGSSSNLRLQDLTRKDIQRFVVDKLQDIPKSTPLSMENPLWLNNITGEIQSRAEGVFLWVNLAVKDQLRGFRNHDSLEQLEERLDCLPDEVEGIYARMLDQIKKPYRREASRFLQIALHDYIYQLLDVVLASHGRLDNMLLSADKIPETELIKASHSIRSRIADTCAGLLEVHSQDDAMRDGGPGGGEPDSGNEPPALSSPAEVTLDEIHDLSSNVRVDWIHRTARDFMRDGEQGGKFLKAKKSFNFDSQVIYVKVLLARARLFGYRDRYRDIFSLMTETWSAENETRMAQIQLSHLIDLNMSRFDRNLPNWRPDTHWCTRWEHQLEAYLQADSSDTALTPHSGSCSSSSSNDSFYSISSQPKAMDVFTIPSSASVHNSGVEPGQSALPSSCGRSVADDGIDLNTDIGFLTVATIYSLSRYVQQTLTSRMVPLTKDQATFLLNLSVRSIDIGRVVLDKYLTSLDLVGQFLDHDGDPDFKPSDCPSTWSEFLFQMNVVLHSHLYGDGERNVEQAELAELRTPFGKATMAFLEKGADVHTISRFYINSEDWKAPQYPTDGHVGMEWHKVRYRMHIPALAVIELCLGDLPKIAHVKDMCIAKGVRCDVKDIRVMAMIVYADDDRSLCDHICKEWFELSENESTTFVDIFKKHYLGTLPMELFRQQIAGFNYELSCKHHQSATHLIDEEAKPIQDLSCD